MQQGTEACKHRLPQGQKFQPLGSLKVVVAEPTAGLQPSYLSTLKSASQAQALTTWSPASGTVLNVVEFRNWDLSIECHCWQAFESCTASGSGPYAWCPVC